MIYLLRVFAVLCVIASSFLSSDAWAQKGTALGLPLNGLYPGERQIINNLISRARDVETASRLMRELPKLKRPVERIMFLQDELVKLKPKLDDLRDLKHGLEKSGMVKDTTGLAGEVRQKETTEQLLKTMLNYHDRNFIAATLPGAHKLEDGALGHPGNVGSLFLSPYVSQKELEQNLKNASMTEQEIADRVAAEDDANSTKQKVAREQAEFEAAKKAQLGNATEKATTEFPLLDHEAVVSEREKKQREENAKKLAKDTPGPSGTLSNPFLKDLRAAQDQVARARKAIESTQKQAREAALEAAKARAQVERERQEFEAAKKRQQSAALKLQQPATKKTKDTHGLTPKQLSCLQKCGAKHDLYSTASKKEMGDAATSYQFAVKHANDTVSAQNRRYNGLRVPNSVYFCPIMKATDKYIEALKALRIVTSMQETRFVEEVGSCAQACGNDVAAVFDKVLEREKLHAKWKKNLGFMPKAPTNGFKTSCGRNSLISIGG